VLTVEPLELAPLIDPDGRRLNFTLSLRGREVDCSISREALERHFWLQPGASDTRILKAFEDGRGRILAVAERKALAHASERISLGATDFEARM
jgi:hypothetical protein